MINKCYLLVYSPNNGVHPPPTQSLLQQQTPHSSILSSFSHPGFFLSITNPSRTAAYGMNSSVASSAPWASLSSPFRKDLSAYRATRPHPLRPIYAIPFHASRFPTSICFSLSPIPPCSLLADDARSVRPCVRKAGRVRALNEPRCDRTNRCRGGFAVLQALSRSFAIFST